MKTLSCEAFNMTCSGLLEASSKESKDQGILCPLANENQDGISGWSICTGETRTHYLQAKAAAPQTKPRIQEKKGNPTRRPYFRQEHSPQNVIPFRHHKDLSIYMKEYTKYQSFTMGQDTDYVIRYELMGPSRNVHSRWKDQFSSLGVRGEGVQEDQGPSFSYVHNSQDKSGHKKAQGYHGQDQPLVYHKEQQLKKPHDAPVPSPSTIPDRSVVDKQPSISLTLGPKGECRSKKQIKDTSVDSKSFMIGGTNFHEDTRHPQGQTPQGHYSNIEEYYVKQIENEFREKLRNSRGETAVRYGQLQSNGDGHLDMQPTVQQIQQARRRTPSTVDYTESDPYSPDLAPRGRKVDVTREVFDNDDSSQMLKLPPLQEHVDNIAASHEKEKDARESVPKLKFPKRKKGTKGGKKFTNSKYYMDLPSPSRRFAKDLNDVPDYKTATVHQSIPPLASMYSSPDETSRVNKKQPPERSEVVLPKLHKWLSDSAVHKVLWDETQENRSPEPSYRSLKAASNQRNFSQEFLEYANQLHNREVVYTKVYDNQNSGRFSPGIERETQSLPDTVHNVGAVHTSHQTTSTEQTVSRDHFPNELRISKAHQQTQETVAHASSKHASMPDNAQFIVVSSHVGPPPNTPNEVYIPAMSVTQLRQPEQRIKDHEINNNNKTVSMRATARHTKKVGAKLRMPRVNLLPEPDKTTVRTNEHVVEVVGSLPSVGRDRDGTSKYLSSSMTPGRAVWRS